MESREASAASKSTSALAAALRAPWTASPGRRSVFEGMHAQYEHSPRTRPRSTIATRNPPSAKAPAQCSPGEPALDHDHVVVAAHFGSARAGIDSASAARRAGASKGSAKYWVSCVTRPSVISMTLSEYVGTPS